MALQDSSDCCEYHSARHYAEASVFAVKGSSTAVDSVECRIRLLQSSGYRVVVERQRMSAVLAAEVHHAATLVAALLRLTVGRGRPVAQTFELLERLGQSRVCRWSGVRYTVVAEERALEMSPPWHNRFNARVTGARFRECKHGRIHNIHCACTSPLVAGLRAHYRVTVRKSSVK